LLLAVSQVAFGTLVQLMLEGDEAEFTRVMMFNQVSRAVPTTLCHRHNCNAYWFALIVLSYGARWCARIYMMLLVAGSMLLHLKYPISSHKVCVCVWKLLNIIHVWLLRAGCGPSYMPG